MGVNCYQMASMALTLCASGVFLAAFAGTGWLTGPKHDLGLWRMCESNTTGSERCEHLALGGQGGYFVACRALAICTLVLCVVSFVACFLEDNDTDTDLKRACYRHCFCLSSLLTVALQIITIAVMGSNHKEDPALRGMEMETGWCVPASGASAVLAFLSSLCRFKFNCSRHSKSGSSCLADHHIVTNKTAHLDLGLDLPEGSSAAADGAEASMRNARGQMPSLALRRTSSATSSNAGLGLDGRITHLPPLPLKSRGGGGLARTSSLKSTDSGLDSRDISRDSILDEGPLPLSVEMLRRHDRRLTGRGGGGGGGGGSSGRLDDSRRRSAFSSTTSLSTIDSQSSAELAPRVHTPINQKRVHYNDVPKESPHPAEPPSPSPPLSPTPDSQPSPAADPCPEVASGGSERPAVAPPIISFPIKTQGVELSRARTNAATSATIDNLRSISSALRKWKGGAGIVVQQPTAEKEEEGGGEGDGGAGTGEVERKEEKEEEGVEESTRGVSKKQKAKKKKSKRSSKKKETEQEGQ